MRALQIALLTVAGIASAHAGEWRIGLGAGQAKIETDDGSLKDKTTAWEVFGGWEFNRYLAVEAGYIDGGTAKDNFMGATIEADASAWQASVIGSWPFTDVMSVYGRAGVLKWKTDEEARVNGTVLATLDDSGSDFFYGAGWAGNFEGNALLRLEYRRAKIADSDLDLITLGIAWRF